MSLERFRVAAVDPPAPNPGALSPNLVVSTTIAAESAAALTARRLCTDMPATAAGGVFGKGKGKVVKNPAVTTYLNDVGANTAIVSGNFVNGYGGTPYPANIGLDQLTTDFTAAEATGAIVATHIAGGDLESAKKQAKRIINRLMIHISGLPGAGKTTAGKHLQRIHNLWVIDTDDLITPDIRRVFGALEILDGDEYDRIWKIIWTSLVLEAIRTAPIDRHLVLVGLLNNMSYAALPIVLPGPEESDVPGRVYLYYIDASAEQLKRNLEKRHDPEDAERPLDFATLERMKQFHVENGYTLVRDSEDVVNRIVNYVLPRE